MTMAQTTRAGLNDSGKEGATRIFTRGALHYSQGQRTSRHAHYAWKIHVGIDAPVWLESTSTCIRARDGARVIIVPPGVEHSTGAVGWSTALFLAPGTRGTPWRAISGASAMGGAAAGRIVQACRELYAVKREATPDVAAELARLVFHGNAAVLTIDARVENALELLRQDTGIALPELARRTGISLDRLSRLTTRHTGLHLRRHVLWNRVIRLLVASARHGTIAAAALAAGFSDHAHATRTCRQFLGRSPSDFATPPDAICAW